MTAAGDVLNQVVPSIARLIRRPGALLLRFAAGVIGLFALLGLAFALIGSGGSAWVPLSCAGILAVPVVVLAVRRARLHAQTEGLDGRRTVTAFSGTLVEPGPGSESAREEDLESLASAMAEGGLLTARFFPRLEAAQRGALLAAGGPANAPYLRDDLRVTVAALLGTVAAIPLAAVGSIVTLILLLAA